MAAHAGPERTCVGCRRKGPKGSLLRVVRSPEGELVPDPGYSAPGRGAYVHGRSECLQLAIDKGSFARQLRASLGRDAAVRLRDRMKDMGAL
jgi:predicted RNA-binding protein YlxR (DUF448 family)